MNRCIRSAATALAIGSFIAGMLTVPAAAHVEVAPESAPRGSLSVLSFVVPNESETTSTVTFEVEFPRRRPIASVAVQPLPGWTFSVDETPGNGGTTRVSRVVWTGGTFGPGEFQQFVVRAALPKEGATVNFKAVQTYSDGEVVRWIQPTAKGAPEPEYPAPVLQLEEEDDGH